MKKYARCKTCKKLLEAPTPRTTRLIGKKAGTVTEAKRGVCKSISYKKITYDNWGAWRKCKFYEPLV